MTAVANIRNWSRGEALIVLLLMRKLPFGKVRESNPDLQKCAALLDRTPASVKMKIGNFWAYLPSYTKEGRLGLKNASRLDREIMEQFRRNQEGVLCEAADAARRLDPGNSLGLLPKEVVDMPDRTECTSEVAVRLVQSLFRSNLLEAYEGRCCITKISAPELLIASHIKPWREATDLERVTPGNGLLLSAIHDKAFDSGLITLNDHYEVMLSPQLSRNNLGDHEVLFERHEQARISLPAHEKDRPSLEFLDWHRRNCFKSLPTT